MQIKLPYPNNTEESTKQFMDIVYILKTMSLNFTQKDRVVALPCVVSDYTIAIKLNYPTDPRKKWEFPIYAVIDQRLASVNRSWLCQKKNKQKKTTIWHAFVIANNEGSCYHHGLIDQPLILDR